MTDETFPNSNIPIRKTSELLPNIFKTEANEKFLSGTLDPLVQPGKLDKTIGYIGRRYGKTYNSKDVYLDTDDTLRSRYQLEPGVVIRNDSEVKSFYDYIDLKNQLKFFGNDVDRDDLLLSQESYSWDPPIEWDKFVNFREYYWVPDGPPPVKIVGQSQQIVSTYKVRLGVGSVFIFTPDGFKNNPTITLYRGQTYKFNVNTPDNGFVVRTNYDTGSLAYNPSKSYSLGEFAIFDGKLWQAKANIPFTEGSTINEESEDWQYIESAAQPQSFDYTQGITNNGTTQGTLIFAVPLDAPDVLFYQSTTDPNRFGRFIIADIEENTKIDIDNEIIGKVNYTSSNNVEFTNGMLVYFVGNITPIKYKSDTWIVEGVGSRIKLVRFQDLSIPQISIEIPEVLFDNSGFDTEPFDDASSYPGTKDYLTINRASQDLNAWSRYNRWFHSDVLKFSHEFNGTTFDSPSESRAKRPIIEFKSDLRLYNHGTKAKLAVDYIDTVTNDVFSEIEGSEGYYVDGEELFQGARVLFTADTDVLANNKIYEVNFIEHSTGSAFRNEWSVFDTYRTGETVRYLGQSFTSKEILPSRSITIAGSLNSSKRFRVPKNTFLQADQAITFTGGLFGGVLPDVVYFVIEVFNTESTFTEFTISEIKRGPVFNLTTGAPGIQSMVANYSQHPTDINYWAVSNDRRQINLKKISDSDSVLNECVLVKRGRINRQTMYHFDGKSWKKSQNKTAVNQSPRFDVIDDNSISFSNLEVYPVSNFAGSKILSYKIGNSVIDPELNFSLSYLNIDNIGDILFVFDWDNETFSYEVESQELIKKISTGYYQFNDIDSLGNSWTKIDNRYSQPIIYSNVYKSSENFVTLDAVKWTEIQDELIDKIILYVNGFVYRGTYTRDGNKFILEDSLNDGDVVSIKVFADVIPDKGYYEIPLALEKNPLNSPLIEFSLGQAVDHISTSIDLLDNFKGTFPGVNNLRDISDYTKYSRRFIKHSGIAPLAIDLLCDKGINVIKSLNLASKSYQDFKNSFLQVASQLDYDQDPINFVDEVILFMNRSKGEADPWLDSDMLGVGAYSSLEYIVEDTGIKTFSLSKKFDLQTPSRSAVYIYINGVQLFNSKDYSFDANFGFVNLLIDLNEGDKVEIREYTSTAYCYVPPTPTKLGLYKKYLPEKFVDDTYNVPTLVVRGHDGSTMVAFNDYRDDVLLELETRIYNNIKIEYNRELFDIDNMIAGAYGNAVYTKYEFDNIIDSQFRKWSVTQRVDSVTNSFYNNQEPFTFNYSDMRGPLEINLPGYWRGIYHYFYDTDRPHRSPWEMLGFSEKPVWWDSEYGPAPYTSNNLILWEDLKEGIVRQGPSKGTHLRYKRSTLLSHLPVDGDGNLLDPINSNLISFIKTESANANYKFGDIAPAEYAWRSSSEFPFSVIIACCLMKPFEFIPKAIDRLSIKKNKIDQYVNIDTNIFSITNDVRLAAIDTIHTSGLINYLVDYQKYLGVSAESIIDNIQAIDVSLSSRLSGFVDKQQQRFVLDSKNPNTSSSSVFIPQENYIINFNISSPIKTLSYSGLIVSKTEAGLQVFGYDNLDPAFKYYSVFPQSSDPLISVGGVSENFLEWAPSSNFNNGTIVRFGQNFYKAIKTHNSTDSFENDKWQRIAKLPLVGAAEAFQRTKFNKTTAKVLPYGTTFNKMQDLVDFICGYEAYLVDQGFEFNVYDQDLAVARNWKTSIKELLFWSKHNWSTGSLISLSPAANKIVLNFEAGVLEDLLDSFYDYSILQADGNLIKPEQINVTRQFRKLEIDTVSSDIGIYLFRGYMVLKEHVVIFSDRTVFNDVIYDKPTGYRQERIKSRGFRTSDWDGDYTSPGFIFDNVNILAWQPYTDYSLGDIVVYKSYYYTSLEAQRGLSKFDDSKWTRLDLIPEKQLIANFDFKANQFADFYDLDSDGIGQSQRDLARHALAYQKREYLQAMAEDDVTQFKLYQGFIKEKGTRNSIDKVFSKLSNVQGAISINEEWAFRLGNIGGKDQVYEIEIEIKDEGFEVDPQPLLVVEGVIENLQTDQYYRINQTDFLISPVEFTKNVNPVIKYTGTSRSAGFVKSSDIDYVVKNKEDLLSLDIDTIENNSNIWITFDNSSWTVLRFEYDNTFIIRDILGPNNLLLPDLDSSAITSFKIISLVLNRPINLSRNEVIGVKDVKDLTGFYKVLQVRSNVIDIEVADDQKEVDFESSTISYNLYFLKNAKFQKYSDVDQEHAALLPVSSKIWIENGYSDQEKWQVVQKNKRFNVLEVDNYFITSPTGIGTGIAYSEVLKQSFFSITGSGYVASAVEFQNKLLIKQLIAPVTDLEDYVNNSFGESISVSPDGKWLAIASPRASGAPNNYKGLFEPTSLYSTGDIVLYQGRLWTATSPFTGDSSGFVLDADKPNWQPSNLITVNLQGNNLGPTNHGMVSLYRYVAGQWVADEVLLSPRLDTGEFFGSEVKLAVDGIRYFLIVSAKGSVNNLGRVYIFVHENSQWKMSQNQNYKGVYDGQAETYPQGSIVWFENALYRSTQDHTGDGSTTLDVESGLWEKITFLNIETALPQRISYELDDGSTLATGIFEDSTGLVTSLAEIVKMGDQFGHSLAINRDASILAVGVPLGDNQYFANYRGDWRPYQEYVTGDVVRYHDAVSGLTSYRRLFDPRPDEDPNTDSAQIYISVNELPAGDPWEIVGDSSSIPIGKVFIYQRKYNDVYSLVQTIAASNINNFSDIHDNELSTGDQFGFSIDMDSSGYTLVISSPFSDINFNSQGSVYVFRTVSLDNIEFRLKQKLKSFERYPNEQFGSCVSVSGRSERLVVGAKNAKFKFPVTFDATSTEFDNGKTSFSDDRGNSGQVYVFEKKDQTYFLVEKLNEDLQDFESFGEKIDASTDFILTASPKYLNLVNAGSFIPGEAYTIKSPGNTDWYSLGLPTSSKAVYGSRFTATGVGAGSGTAFSQTISGKVRLFKKESNLDSWTVIDEEKELIDLTKIINLQLIDKDKNLKISDLEFVDHYKLRILGVAEQELKFKTLYDPAIYSVGTFQHEVDPRQAWEKNNVGQLWWDLSTVKFHYFEQGDIAYRISQANKQVPFSSVDVYEWVESRFLPSQWTLLADTTEGIALGVSGIPKYPDDTVYSVKEIYNVATGELTDTKYYFWVKNKTIVPSFVSNRRLSSIEVSNLISNPEASGIPFVTFLDRDAFLLYNLKSTFASSAAINIQYSKGYKNLNPVHREYLLLTEGLADSLPNYQLESKWIDSLVGYDSAGRKVPDEKLPSAQRYGIEFRPRQTMFIDRFEVLDAVLSKVNTILLTRPFADTISFNNLNSYDVVPSDNLNEYDVVVDNFIDLQNVGTVRIKRAVLVANIVNGRIDTIEIRDPGFGYKVPPFISVSGDGEGAEAFIDIDNVGRVVAATVTNQGRNYTTAIVSIRNFSVLVSSDETVRNYWSIYAWDDKGKSFIKSKIQSFDTRRFWKYVDWYAENVSIVTKISKEIISLYQESTISVDVGDVIKIKEFASGGWALLRRTEIGKGEILEKYNLIGREAGTLQINKEEFLLNNKIGFDSVVTFDGEVFDLQPSKELRNIFKSIKEDIFLESYRVEWNKIFFDSIRYALLQNNYVDWAFKTSFLTAKHTIGSLNQKIYFKNDNIDSFESYLEEVKPYRTTIREFLTQYNSLDLSNQSVSDFDSPPAYSVADGRIMPVGKDYKRFDEYPWKWFNDNQGYSIDSIEVYSRGSGYTYPPSVLIEGDGTGCEAKAYISNGGVSGIQIISSGRGYTYAPKISLVGGNGASQDISKATAILGRGLIRSLNTTIKFDRLSKIRNQLSFTQSEQFIAGGFTASFELKYAPMVDKNKISVYKNNQLVLSDSYFITLYKTGSYNRGILKAKITFKDVPAVGDIIDVDYDKNNDYLDALSRIEKYYFPQEGMKGKEFGQLMTGIDFGGVQIQGTTFDVTGGWDALPWFTDNWDSVESSADFYYVADGSTTYVDLPFIPAAGENISIYLQKRYSTSPRNINTLNDPNVNPVYIVDQERSPSQTIRIDDPNYNDEWDSSIERDSTVLVNPNAQMPTFVGDGESKRVRFINPVTDLPYIQIEAGDTLIFRRDTSDGSVVINDVNIVDTSISGGSLSSMEGAYVTATGRTTDEIIIDGEKFISPDQVSAPEENVPGQILEGLSIKVFQAKPQSSAAMQNAVYFADGVTRFFEIKLRVIESKSILVYVDKMKVDDSSNTYEIDYVSNRVIFYSPPNEGSIIEIISIGIGGVNLLDYQEFVGVGDTDLFLTQARFNETVSIIVTLDGDVIDAIFIDSGEYSDTSGKTMVQVGYKPQIGQVLKIICLGASLDTDSLGQSLIRLNSQTLFYDGSSRRLELDRFVNLTRASASSAMIVEVNGQLLIGVDTIRVVYDGSNNSIVVGKDPFRVSGLIGLNDFEVYINNEIQPVITAYTFDSFSKTVVVNPDLLALNDEIKIITTVNVDYTVIGNDIIISESRAATMIPGDRIEITWFSEYPTFDIIMDEYTGGQSSYLLKRNPISDSYVWVYKNGNKLTLNQDYELDSYNQSIKLSETAYNTDLIKIIEFGNKIWTLPHAYEIHKDMLNLTYYTRFSLGNIQLDQDLTYYSTEIYLNDASSLFEPQPGSNRPGVIYVNEEKIEYFEKIGNTLSKLRRGAFGTPIAEVYAAGTKVADMSRSEYLPYSDIQDRYDFVSDGSTLLIGPLDFVPRKSVRSFWIRTSIPDTYGACDQFEVFAGGQRLKKDSVVQYNENLGSQSPGADEIIEAEFSVDGVTPYIRLTAPVPAGTRINIIKRRGKTWYDKGTNTAQNGRSMTDSNNAIVRFILQKESYLPE